MDTATTIPVATAFRSSHHLQEKLKSLSHHAYHFITRAPMHSMIPESKRRRQSSLKEILRNSMTETCVDWTDIIVQNSTAFDPSGSTRLSYYASTSVTCDDPENSHFRFSLYLTGSGSPEGIRDPQESQTYLAYTGKIPLHLSLDSSIQYRNANSLINRHDRSIHSPNHVPPFPLPKCFPIPGQYRSEYRLCLPSKSS